MRTPIVKVGNSRGIRIPKPVLEQCQFSDEVELEVHEGKIIISSPEAVRSSWEQQFQRMHEAGEDRLIDPETDTQWQANDWQWS